VKGSKKNEDKGKVKEVQKRQENERRREKA
jgi:hypothetical protein